MPWIPWIPWTQKLFQVPCFKHQNWWIFSIFSWDLVGLIILIMIPPYFLAFKIGISWSITNDTQWNYEMMPSQDPCLIHGMNPSFGVEYWPWLVVPNMLYVQHCSTIESANTSIIEEKQENIVPAPSGSVSVVCPLTIPYPQSNVARENPKICVDDFPIELSLHLL